LGGTRISIVVMCCIVTCNCVIFIYDLQRT